MAKDDKNARLAEALRANLRRRKAQAREQRDEGGAPAPSNDDADGAGRDD